MGVYLSNKGNTPGRYFFTGMEPRLRAAAQENPSIIVSYKGEELS